MWNDEASELDAKGLRRFAFTIGGTVALLFGVALPWLFGRTRPVWPWVVAGVFAAWPFVLPAALRNFHRVWMWLGLKLSKVTTPIVLGVLFFLVILPVGIVRRHVRGDGLSRELDRSATSYKIASKKAAKDNLERPY
jgi:hypothetical protein